MLLRVDLNIEIVVGERKGLAVEGESVPHRDTEGQEEAKVHDSKIHFSPEELSRARLCLTISYSTTAAATETFRDDTLPSMGIETRKSHFLFTKSCRPLPSAPRTSAQSML